jgi:cobalt-zinc-cadmium efflux system protein
LRLSIMRLMDHNHEATSEASKLFSSKRIALSFGLTIGLIVAEAAAGWIANSLALLTDAAHNLTDAIALGLSWYALRLATRPATAKQTFGRHRAGILVALVNSTTLVVLSIWVFIEAYRRFQTPSAVETNVMIGVGFFALAVNAITALLVRHGSDHDLNLRSAYIHLMGDVLSTVGAIVAGILITVTHAAWFDPLASILIGVLILWNAWGILQETLEILLEDVPRDIDVAEMVTELIRLPGVRGIHDLHVWSITREMRVLSAHVVTDSASIRESADVRDGINTFLRDHYHIRHATLQLEEDDCAGCPL